MRNAYHLDPFGMDWAVGKLYVYGRLGPQPGQLLLPT